MVRNLPLRKLPKLKELAVVPLVFTMERKCKNIFEFKHYQLSSGRFGVLLLTRTICILRV